MCSNENSVISLYCQLRVKKLTFRPPIETVTYHQGDPFLNEDPGLGIDIVAGSKLAFLEGQNWTLERILSTASGNTEKWVPGDPLEL